MTFVVGEGRGENIRKGNGADHGCSQDTAEERAEEEGRKVTAIVLVF